MPKSNFFQQAARDLNSNSLTSLDPSTFSSLRNLKYLSAMAPLNQLSLLILVVREAISTPKESHLSHPASSPTTSTSNICSHLVSALFTSSLHILLPRQQPHRLSPTRRVLLSQFPIFTEWHTASTPSQSTHPLLLHQARL